MGKMKSICLIICLLLFALTVVIDCLSVKGFFTVPVASSYQDSDTHTVEPYQVLPVQVQNTSAHSCDRRMTPTKTVYMRASAEICACPSIVGSVHSGLSCDMGRDTVEETAVTTA